MYLIVVKFPVKPDSADRWMDIVADYTAACRSEEGNLFFEWSRSVEDPQGARIPHAIVQPAVYDAVERLTCANGTDFDATAAAPWNGDRLDLDFAISALHP